MNPSDDDLNCLLMAWTIPESAGSLERRLRRAYRDRTRSRSERVWTRWIAGLAPAVAGMCAGIAAGAVVFLLAIAEAFPQSLSALSGTTFPFTVDSEEIEYKADGSSAIREYFTSAGGGLVLSSEFPGDPLRTAQQRILDPLNLILYRISAPFVDRQQARLNAQYPVRAKHIAEQQRTCGAPGAPWTVVGNETILNYATTGVQKVWMEEGKPVRLTQWSAPDLDCFALKSTTEKTFDDGRLRLAFELRALRVTMNAPASKVLRPPNR
jgi:hypothetical protein